MASLAKRDRASYCGPGERPAETPSPPAANIRMESPEIDARLLAAASEIGGLSVSWVLALLFGVLSQSQMTGGLPSRIASGPKRVTECHASVSYPGTMWLASWVLTVLDEPAATPVRM